MKEKILIVEDQFVEADYLQLMLAKAGYRITGIARSVQKARELITKERPDFVLLDIFLKGKHTGIDLAHELAKENIPFVYLSANSNEEVLNLAKATQPYGFLVKPFRERDLLVTIEVARYRHEHSTESHLRNESILKEKISAITTGEDNWENKLLNIARAFQLHLPFDYFTTGFNDSPDLPIPGLSFLRIGYNEYQKIGISELATITGIGNKELQELMQQRPIERTPAMCIGQAFEQECAKPSLDKLFADNFGLKSRISCPLHLSNGQKLSVNFYSRISDTYDNDHLALLNRLQGFMIENIENLMNAGKPSFVYESQKSVKQLHDQRNSTYDFEGIVGRNHLLLNVFDMITQVAPSDTSVLILGESGTGKERIAECIHNLSPRKNKPLVKVNCATLPPTLIESELFGHEKGSFTGAMEKRVGKFEKADKGTIFLDEIGEMPLELQAKLLRVLQERYIERIGAKEPISVDVRIIAATNRNLEKEVAEGRFRLDLYYRLNVFPVELPALRERTDDIHALSLHFINYYNRKTGKNITGLSEQAVERMKSYHWPGNIRELENIIERSVLLTKGTIIENIVVGVDPKKLNPIQTKELRLKTIFENERDHIITVLKNCNGKIWGGGGAAEVLNVPSSTLRSKMKKLGIRKEDIE
jgi:DNA-binding NtrC family response regulator